MTDIVTHLAFAIKDQALSYKKLVTKADDYHIVEFVPTENFGLHASNTNKTVFCYAVMPKESTRDYKSLNQQLREQLHKLKQELENEKTNVSILRTELASAEAALTEARKLRFD